MTLANCRRCGRLFNRVRRDICVDCIQAEEEDYLVVRTYLKDHRDASLPEVTRDTGVPMESIMAMIRDGRMVLCDFPNLAYPCERCGEPTQAGRFCTPCSEDLQRELTEARDYLLGKVEQSQVRNGRGYLSK